jgi:glutathione S-transferase
VKVRSYFRYKPIPHEWVVRSQENAAEFRQYARLPLIPLVLTPNAEGLQDSTPILGHFEALHPEPSIHPPGTALAFLSALIEEYADEWGNKPMFHYRWTYEADQRSAAERIARENLPGAPPEAIAQTTRAIIERMVPRLRFVGSSSATKEQIEGSFERVVKILETHLTRRPYLFGSRPALADFGLAPQLYQCASDPTPAELLARKAPAVLAWTRRMLAPKAEGPFESWETLMGTLTPLLEREVAAVFLPWSDANAKALGRGEAEFSVELDGRAFTQQTQKYHAKSLAALRARYAAVRDRAELDPLLETTGCRSWLV